MAAVTLKGIRKTFDGGAEVIKGIDLDIHDGEFMVFVGPSGCGKSTMMRMVAGLEDITEGELRIGGRTATDLPPVDRGVAMVFQSYALYPHMSVAENMSFGLRIAGLPRAQIDAQVGRAAEILQISHLLERRPKDLSGGQRQRVAIGRAIVRKPGVFLFDEPLSNLDANLRVQMRVELARLHKELGSTMIYVTHDQVEAMTLGDRIAVFNAGSIEQVGRPLDLYEQPANRFVAQFIGSPPMNLLDASLGGSPGNWQVQPQGLAARQVMLPAGIDPAPCGQIGVRPEALQVCDGAQGWPLQIDLAEHLGDATLLHARVPATGAPLCVKLAATRTGLRAGQVAHFAPAPGALHLFDTAGQRLASV